MSEPATVEPPSLRSRRDLGSQRLASPALEPTAKESGEEFRPPRPLRTAGVLLVPILLPVVLWLIDLLPVPAALGFGVSLLLFALVQSGLSAFELFRSRRLGDALLRAYPDSPPVSGLAAWRSVELTSARARRKLVRLVRRLTCETEVWLKPSARPPDRALLDERLAVLRRLESRLELLVDPVSPLGMLDLHALLLDHFSRFNYPGRERQLPVALAQALESLEPA